MNNELIETYRQLMRDLNDLPGRMSEAQDIVTDLKLRISDVEKELAQLEPYLMDQATGKNAEERKAALLKAKLNNAAWQNFEQQLRGFQGDLATANDEVDFLARTYNATCYRARLHASLLNYLAAGGQPVNVGPVSNGEVDFGMGPRRNGNGATVTAEDAKDIGL